MCTLSFPSLYIIYALFVYLCISVYTLFPVYLCISCISSVHSMYSPIVHMTTVSVQRVHGHILCVHSLYIACTLCTALCIMLCTLWTMLGTLSRVLALDSLYGGERVTFWGQHRTPKSSIKASLDRIQICLVFALVDLVVFLACLTLWCVVLTTLPVYVCF